MRAGRRSAFPPSFGSYWCGGWGLGGLLLATPEVEAGGGGLGGARGGRDEGRGEVEEGDDEDKEEQ